MNLERAEAVVKRLIKLENFSLDFDDYEQFDIEAEESDFGKLAHGATKLVFLPYGEDFVIKLGFENKNWSLKKEYEIFKKAEEKKLGSFFAETSNLQETEGIYWIAQERCEPDEDLYYETLGDYWGEEIVDWESKSSYDQKEDLDYLSDADVIEGIFQNFPLSQFIRDEALYDFHSGNFGYRDGDLVLIDFCGC